LLGEWGSKGDVADFRELLRVGKNIPKGFGFLVQRFPSFGGQEHAGGGLDEAL